MKTSPDKFTQIDKAAHSGAFGNNPLPLPTDKQIAAGTYKKGKVALYGLTIAIEQPMNSYRTGIDKNGKRWACRLAANYGYILGTKGNDGDHVDCFIGSYPQSDCVFIINQYVNGVFDEHKIMLAYPAVEFARSDYNFSYARGWDGLQSIVETSVKNFKWWLKNGDMTKPITAEQLPPESEKDMNKIYWDSANQPIGTNTAQLLYDLRKIDADDGLLLDAVTALDFVLDADAGSVDHGVLLDSLHTPYSSLSRVCSKIMLAMKMQQGTDSNGNPLLPVESTPEEPNPSGLDATFKRNGVVNLAAVFQLTDGQSFTIVFHNPDSTPGKLAKTDTLIAWKFLLNKRDISIAVAPEKGEDLKLPEVAKRVMMLAEKNSAAFARANKGAAERAALINGLKTEIAELEIEKTQAQADYEAAKAAYDEREMKKAEMATPNTPVAGFVATHTVNDNGVNVPVARNEDGEFESENGVIYEEDALNEFVPVQSIGQSSEVVNSVPAPELVEPVIEPEQKQEVDPATLANINAANISAAIKKKAIAFFEKNPATKSFEGSGLSKASQKSIMESIKTALVAEITGLVNAIPEEKRPYLMNAYGGGMLAIRSNENELTITVSTTNKSPTGYEIEFRSFIDGERKNLFDSTTTLEDLHAWGFALPFDLDVKGFVNTVIRPVVEEFLSKQQVTEQEKDPDAELRALWTEKGVSPDRQNELIAEIAGKAQMTKDDFFPAGKQLSEVLKAGDLSAALKILNGLGKAGMIDTLLKAGFQLTDTDTIKSLMTYVEPQLIRAAKNKTDGFGLSEMNKQAEKTTVQPSMITKNKIEDAISSLRLETDMTRFNDRLDELANYIESVGLMEQYDKELNELADIAAQMAIENSKKVGG